MFGHFANLEDIIEKMKAVYPEINEEIMKDLRVHFGNDISLVDMLNENTEMKKHEDSELFDHEPFRFSYRFEGYDVMITERQYDDSEYDYTDKVPKPGGYPVLEIYAKPCSYSKYTLLCSMEPRYGRLSTREHPVFIGVVKDNSSISDDTANLVVLTVHEYMSVRPVKYWYAMSSSYKIEQFDVSYEDVP